MNKYDLLSIKTGGRCGYCGVKLFSGGHIEHMIPKIQGGQSVIDNYMLSCSNCNLVKNSKDVEGFREYLKHKTRNDAKIALERLRRVRGLIKSGYKELELSLLSIIDVDVDVSFFFESKENKQNIGAFNKAKEKEGWTKIKPRKRKTRAQRMRERKEQEDFEWEEIQKEMVFF